MVIRFSEVLFQFYDNQKYRMSQFKKNSLYSTISIITISGPLLAIFFNLSNSMDLIPSKEAAINAATDELPTIYGTRRFITTFTRALY
jgi:hypothetical protein